MESTPRSVDFQEVLATELDDIRERRKKAGCEPTSGQQTATQLQKERADDRDLVGLALSGGGVRSGAISLGLLQAFYREGILNQFDYLSTVSGGGYAGSYFSAELEEFKDGTTIDWEPQTCGKTPEENGKKTRKLSFASTRAGAQSGDVRRLIHSGIYLRKLRELINSALLGVLVNWTMIIAGLTAAACAVAIAYRALDDRWLSGVLESIGFAGDTRRAFVFSFVLLLCWIIVQLPQSRTRNSARRAFWTKVSSGLAVLLIASLACGLTVVITTGDLNNTTASTGGPAPERATQIQHAQDRTWIVLVTAIAVSLLPFLRKNDLLRSGTTPSKPWQPWIARIAGWGMLAGVPLLIFAFVAQENLFDYNGRRPDQHSLVHLHVRDWVSFSQTVEREAKANLDGPSARIWSVANRLEPRSWFYEKTSWLWTWFDAARQRIHPGPDVVDAEPSLPLQSIARWELIRRELRQETWFFQRALSPITALFGSNPCSEQWHARNRAVELEEGVIERINREILLDVDFVSTFPQTRPRSLSGLSDNDYLQAVESARRVAQLPQARTVSANIANVNARLDEFVEQEQSASVQEQQLTLELARDRLHRVRQQVEEANRKLLEVWYVDLIRPETTVFSYVVLGQDQVNRLTIGVVALVVFIVLGGFFSVNVTSAHSYYRSRLAEMWVFRQARTGTDIRIGRLKNTARGGPYHLINACVHLIGPNRDVRCEPTECFLFSQQFCGSDRVQYESTATYDSHGISLADAMAISGAALSPLTVSNSPLLFYAMLLTNARLGQWIPNPGDIRSRRYPTFVSALSGYFTGTPEESAYLYVTDGGHHDNTGIEALLRRRCKIIVACDASWDPRYQFLDLLRLFRRMTVFEGIRFTAPDGELVNLDSLVADEKTGLSDSRIVVLRIVYPTTLPDELNRPSEIQGECCGWLIYLKSGLTKNDPPALLRYREDNTAFPHDPTLDQFYDPRRFECYRALGYQLGSDLSKRLPVDRPARKCDWMSRLDFSSTAPAGACAAGPEEPAPALLAVGDRADLHAAQRQAVVSMSNNRRVFNEHNIKEASTQPGVIVLYKKERVIYIGSGAKGIRVALESCSNKKWTDNITSFTDEITASHRERAQQLLEEFKSQHGRLPRFNRSHR